jgi:hypothetical protein
MKKYALTLITIVIFAFSLNAQNNMVDQKKTIIFQDNDGSVYESPNGINFRLIKGSGYWSVYNDTDKYDGMYTMVHEGVLYEMVNSNRIVASRASDNAIRHKPSTNNYLNRIISQYRISVDRQTIGNALILVLQVPEKSLSNISISTVDGRTLYTEKGIKLLKGQQNHYIDITEMPSAPLIITMDIEGIRLSTKHIKR